LKVLHGKNSNFLHGCFINRNGENTHTLRRWWFFIEVLDWDWDWKFKKSYYFFLANI